MITKAGFIAVIGAPNAGKSTFLNAALKTKLAIVTPKAQTTRINLRGILTKGANQFIFVDTPGIHKARRMFDEAIVNEAKQAYTDADVILYIMDAYKGLTGEDKYILKNLKHAKQPVILGINKIDMLKAKHDLLPIMEEVQVLDLFADIIPISALKSDNIGIVLETLEKYLPESPFLYDENSLTDSPTRILAAEITRERVFMYMQDEIPYSIAVETVDMEDRKDGSVLIYQNILIKREAHKPIVIGKGGAMLKKIGETSRKQLSTLLGKKVHLKLHVKIKKDWDESLNFMQEMGLQAPSKT